MMRRELRCGGMAMCVLGRPSVLEGDPGCQELPHTLRKGLPRNRSATPSGVMLQHSNTVQPTPSRQRAITVVPGCRDTTSTPVAPIQDRTRYSSMRKKRMVVATHHYTTAHTNDDSAPSGYVIPARQCRQRGTSGARRSPRHRINAQANTRPTGATSPAHRVNTAPPRLALSTPRRRHHAAQPRQPLRHSTTIRSATRAHTRPSDQRAMRPSPHRRRRTGGWGEGWCRSTGHMAETGDSGAHGKPQDSGPGR